MVLLAPSWFGLQRLIDILAALAVDIGMSCNVMRTVCMIFNPTCKRKAVPCIFSEFTLDGVGLKLMEYTYPFCPQNTCFYFHISLLSVFILCFRK